MLECFNHFMASQLILHVPMDRAHPQDTTNLMMTYIKIQDITYDQKVYLTNHQTLEIL